jgi:mRNA interferase RelE/StbE
VTYAVSILRRAQKELAGIPEPQFERICADIRALSDNPRPHGSRKLTGRPGWRIRVGSYRVIYQVDDTTRTVLILHIGHRRDIYD